MTERPESEEGRLREELFIADLLFGLEDHERAEYERLGGGESAESRSLADVIGALDSAWSGVAPMPLPEHLREKICSDALGELASARVEGPPRSRATPLTARQWFPWLISAACVAIAAVSLISSGLFPGRRGGAEDASEARTRLLASASDLIRADWSDGSTPFPRVSGDIAWSPGQQRGYMRFRGMRVNLPTVEQYQLWIFDRNQDEKTPIDGGVFDITSDGEVVVPIRAALKVGEPYLFAVTVEKPGGVVVSSRARLPVLAAIK